MTDLTATVSLSDIGHFVYDDASGLLYVEDGSGTLQQWDPQTGSFVNSIAIANGNGHFDLTADGRYALAVVNGNVLDRVDLTDFSVTSLAYPQSFFTGYGSSLWDVAATASGVALAATRYLGISTAGDLAEFPATTSSSPIDALTVNNPVQGTQVIGTTLAVSEDRRYALLTGGGLAVYDSVSGSVVQYWSLPGGDARVASVSSAAGMVVALNYNALEVFDLNLALVKDLSSMQRGGSIVGAQFSADGHQLFLWDSTSDKLLVYDPLSWTQVGTVDVGVDVGFQANVLGDTIGDMTVSRDGRFLFLTTGSGFTPSGFEMIDLASRLHLTVTGDASHTLLHGSVGSDTVTGSAANDTIDGGGGDDALDGAGGVNTLSFASATAGVTFSLALQGSAQATGVGSVTASNFQNLTGSAFADHLTGDANNNVIDGGGGGADVLDGGGGTNTLSFASAGSGVTVSLALQGSAQVTGAGTDTVSHFQNLVGSAFNDTLEGDGNDNVIDGGAGTNTVSYARAAAGVTVSLALQGQAQNTIGAGTDALSNFQNVTGTAFADNLTGDANNNVIDGGGGGADVLDGGAGTNTLSFASAGSGVTVSLALQGQAQVTGVGMDTVSNFQNLTGSAFNDSLEGDAAANVLDGGAGTNTVSYGRAASAVTVSLALQGQAQNTGGAGSDTLSNFQSLTGSAFNDTLEGDGNSNVIDGGAGTNTVSYAHAGAGVTVSLALQGSGQHTIGAGTDTLSNFRNLTGSAFNDTLEGDGNDNVLDGGAGTNTVSYAHASGSVTVSLALQGQAQNTVGAGTDTLSNFQNLTGSAFNDTLEGGLFASTTLTGGLGADIFVYGVGDRAVTIADFSEAQGDKIDLRRLAGFTALSQIAAIATQLGFDTVVNFGGGDLLTLKNVTLANLTASDFLLGAAPIQVGNATVTTESNLTLTVSSGPLVQFTDPNGGTLINQGALTLDNSSSSTQAAVTTAAQTEPNALFENYGVFTVNSISGLGVSAATTHNYGTFNVSGGVTGGIGATGDFINYGTVTVQGSSYTVYGVEDRNFLFQNKAGATFQVLSSSSQAMGVSLQKGGAFTNDGALTVSATGAAWGLQLVTGSVPSTIVNTGTITATGSASYGIEVDTLTQGGAVSLENDGAINAQTAIFYNGSTAANIVNHGTLNGAVFLGSGTNDVVNTGTISGAVTLGNGSGDILDSHLGHVTGTVTVGTGSSTVTLGSEDNTVFLAAGVHVVDGGGGTNTVSYAGATSGVTVSLAAQGAAQSTGVGTDTLSNIQKIIGSGSADTLTASNGTSTLTGGGGGDTFRILSGAAHTTITDFHYFEGDKLDLTALTQFSSLADVQAAAAQVGSTLVISLGSGGTLTLPGVSTSMLTASNVLVHAGGGGGGGGGGGTPQGLHINVSYDASANLAPTGFKTAVQAAVNFFQTAFGGANVTVNIAFGWGTLGSTTVDADAVAENLTNYDVGLSYQSVRNALIAADADDPNVAAAAASLPLSNPAVGAQFGMTTAEARALGLLSGGPAIDGHVGLSIAHAYTFDPGNRAVAGAYDAVGALEHEISEVLGRVIFAGGSQVDGPLDLFRYAAPNVRTFLQGASFFSLDGVQSLKAFNNGSSNSGDDGDWATSSVADSFDAFGSPGTKADVSPVDLLAMEILGYGLTPGYKGPPLMAPAGGGTVNGTAGDDWLVGQGGDDTFHGGPGSDELDGGPGLNTATYDGAYRQYTVDVAGTGGTVSGGPEGGDDDLYSIQRIQFVDGYLAVSATDTAGQVYRLYEAALGRPPDPVGLAGWTHALNGGTSLQSVADGFVTSQEFLHVYGQLTDKDFVTLLYHNVLHRDPDPDGLNGWLGAMAQGVTRAQILLGFSESQENINVLAGPVEQGLWIQDAAAAEVARLYDTTLGRLPDQGGLAGWTHALENGSATLLQVTQGFIGSQEFQQVYGPLTDNQFVTLLYHNVLHRDPDQDGLNGWTGALSQGVSRAQIVLGFSESPEHIQNTAIHIDNGIWLTG